MRTSVRQLDARIHAALLAVLLLGAITGHAGAALEIDYLDSELWTYHRDAKVQGDRLVTVLQYGLQIWDVTDPALPVQQSKFYTGTQRAYAVDLLDDVVAVTTLGGTLFLVDASDPAAPTTFTTLTGIGTSPDVALHRAGTRMRAYTAGNTSNGLRIYDISDPGTPVFLGSAPISGLESVVVPGDTLLALGVGSGLFSVDVSNPAAPVILDQETPLGSFTNVSAEGALAVVAAMDEGFYVYDVSNLGDPVEVAHVYATVNADFSNLRVMEVILDGTLLYAVTNFGGPLVYDLGVPSAPLLIGYDPQLDISSQAPFVAFRDGDIAGGHLYACHLNTDDSGVMIFDILGADPVPVGLTQSFDYTRFAGANSDLIFGCTGETGLYGIRYTVPQGLTMQGHLQLSRVWGVDTQGTTVYVAATTDGLVISDWTSPANPTILSALPLSQARAVKAVGDIAYVCAFTTGLHSVDVSDTMNPVLLDTEIQPGMACARIDIAGSLAATADEGGGLNLWDVSDPANMLHLSNYPTPDKALDVVIHGNYAYVAVKWTGVHILDISDPTLPVYLNFFESHATGVALSGDMILVSAGTFGMMAYSLGDPVNPVFEGSFENAGDARAVFVLPGNMAVLADDSGLTVLALNDVTGAGDLPDTFGSHALAAWPNPFNPRTDISFELAAPAEVELAIYDLSGRRVRQLMAGRLDAGTAQFSWDGRDASATALPSGVYFARLVGREIASGTTLAGARKLVLIR